MALTTKVDALATRIGQEIKSLWSSVNAKAPIASPTFTGTPAAPTAAAGTNSTQLATTAFVTTAVAAAGGSNPLLLDGGSPESTYTSSDLAFDGGTP